VAYYIIPQSTLEGLLGLGKILAFSIMTGISFAFAYRTSGGQSEIGAGFTILNLMSQNLGPSLQVLVMIASSVFAIYFVYRLAKFFREVYENRIFGIAVAALGFSGSLLVVLAPQNNSNVIILGIAMWLVGLIVVMYHKNKIKA